MEQCEYIYIYKVVAKHRICDFSIPQVTWNANKHRIWLDFMLDFKAIHVEVNLVQGFIQNNRLELGFVDAPIPIF